MSSNFKSVPTAHPDPVRAANLYRLAIVGAGTLKGKEVAEILGVPENTVKTRMFHARRRLSELLAQAGIDRTYQ